MKYYLVLTPDPIIQAILDESKRIVKTVYDKDVDQLYYRVQTKEVLDHPRRLFFKGDGRVIEASVRPHISLVHNIELEEIAEFVEQARRICDAHPASNLIFDSFGNHGLDFTFYVKFQDNPEILALRNELLALCKGHMSEEEYQQHVEEAFVPHATILYDDIDPEKVDTAFTMLDKTRFSHDVPVTEVVLWQVSAVEQKPVATFSLRK